MLVNSTSKVFEKPKSGLYRGVLADVVDLGPITRVYKGKTRVAPEVRLVWVLNAKDTEGNNFRVMRQVTASMSEKANLFGIVRDILLTTPAIPFELETLIGKNSELVIALEESKKNPGTFNGNVKAIMAPLTTLIFAVPADFVRNKDKKDKEATSTQSAAPAQAATAAAAPQPIEDEDIPF